MAQAENFVGEPGVDGTAQLVELAGKEMIDAFDDDQVIFPWELGNERSHFSNGAVLVVASVHEKFGFVALAQK